MQSISNHYFILCRKESFYLCLKRYIAYFFIKIDVPMFEILPMLPIHWKDVKRIYEEGIATGNATFEDNAPSWEAWDHAHLPFCRLVAINDKRLIGWLALSPTSARSVYAGVAAISIYITTDARNKGAGKQLLSAAIAQSERLGIWTLEAGVFPENIASIHLHQACGFRVVGRREKIGCMHGVWRDTVLLERRSAVTGIK